MKELAALAILTLMLVSMMSVAPWYMNVFGVVLVLYGIGKGE